jgi:hypothetical protein
LFRKTRNKGVNEYNTSEKKESENRLNQSAASATSSAYATRRFFMEKNLPLIMQLILRISLKMPNFFGCFFRSGKFHAERKSILRKKRNAFLRYFFSFFEGKRVEESRYSSKNQAQKSAFAISRFRCKHKACKMTNATWREE